MEFYISKHYRKYLKYFSLMRTSLKSSFRSDKFRASARAKGIANGLGPAAVLPLLLVLHRILDW